MLWNICSGEQCQCYPHHMHMVWATHILWITCYILWVHIVWVIYCGHHGYIPWDTYAVGIYSGRQSIYCGEHMLWIYTVDDTIYTVGNTSIYIPWVICCGQQRYMMWVRYCPHYIHNVTHSISPTVYEGIYRGSYAVDNSDI